jgi:hypothetical protein
MSLICTLSALLGALFAVALVPGFLTLALLMLVMITVGNKMMTNGGGRYPLVAPGRTRSADPLHER